MSDRLIDITPSLVGTVTYSYSQPLRAVVIGYGVTGKATAYAFNISDYIDLKTKSCGDLKDYDLFILCLPTPTIDGQQDLGMIEAWLQQIQELKTNPIVVIRSTILPGTTEKLAKKYELRLAFVPEFLTEATALQDALNPELLIIGARDILVKQVVKSFFYMTNVKHLIICNPTTAELIKYAMNSFFGLKVVFANQLWDVAQKVGADYEAVAEALEHHKWGSKNGWNIWQGGFRGFGGHCLPKDIKAFVEAFKLPLLAKAVEINEKLVKEEK